MKRIETLLPNVIPSRNSSDSLNRRQPIQRTLEPFAKIGIVPIDSPAYKAVNSLLKQDNSI